MHFLKFHWGMKALIESHFQHEALLRFIENILRSTLSYPNETLQECIKFLNKLVSVDKKSITIITIRHVYLQTVVSVRLAL